MIQLLITDLREIKKKMLFNFICEQMCGIQGSSASFWSEVQKCSLPDCHQVSLGVHIIFGCIKIDLCLKSAI